MTLLEESIFTLSKTGRAKLRPLQFRGVKKKIFNKVLASRTREGITSEAIIRANKLTAKRYYQILAEILDACYHDFVPEGGTRLLLYLGNKHLFRHFYNELKKQEASLLESKNKRALEQYYLSVLLQRNLFVIHPKFNEKLAEELYNYGKRYLKIKDPDLDDALFRQKLEIDRLTFEPITDPLKGFNRERLNSRIQKLEDIFERVKSGDNILCKFDVSASLMRLLSQFHFEGKSPARYAEFGMQLMNEHPNQFAQIKDYYTLQCLPFMQIEAGKKIGMYKDCLIKTSEHCGTSLNYTAHFFSIIVNSGEIEWGKKFIEKYFPYNIDLLRDDAAIYYYYMLMVYNIYAGNESESEKYLSKAFYRLKGRNRDIHADLLLRCYDVFFTAMHGDPIALENVVNRHIRFGKQHGYERDKTSQMLFLGAVGDLIKYIGFDRLNAEKILQRFQRQFIEISGITQISFLFQKIFNKYFPN